MIEVGDALFGHAMACSRFRDAKKAKELADAEYIAAEAAWIAAGGKRDQYIHEQEHRNGP